MKYLCTISLLIFANILLIQNNFESISLNKNIIKVKSELYQKDTNQFKEHEKFNPKFYLRIFEIHSGATWFDMKANTDKMFRIVLYNIEERRIIVIETIAIGKEGGSLTLLHQDIMDEKVLNLPVFSMTKVKFIKWLS